MNTAERIEKELESRKMTKRYLARKIGMSESGLHAAIRKNSFRNENVQKIASVFNIDLDYLLGRSDTLKYSYKTISNETVQYIPNIPPDYSTDYLERLGSVMNALIGKEENRSLMSELNHCLELAMVTSEYISRCTHRGYSAILDEIHNNLRKRVPVEEIISNSTPKYEKWIKERLTTIELIKDINLSLANFLDKIQTDIPVNDLEFKSSLQGVKDRYLLK